MKKIYNLQNIDFLEIEKSLKAGELIIYPTDTVYGIGGVISSEETIKNIYKAKERSFKSPLIVLVSDVKKIEEVAYVEEKNREAIEKLIATGGLLPTTSANISGEKTPRAYEELSEVFKNRVDLLIDGGRSPLGTESTIIDMSNKPKILRLGAISIEDIEKVIGKI